MPKRRQHFWEFAGFRLDRGQDLLYKGDALVPLPPKAIRTLTTLVERPGTLVTKDELMRAIWPDTFVEESNLTLNIHLLRKALNADGSPERFIETVPRRGYRFIAEVREWVTPEESDAAASGPVQETAAPPIHGRAAVETPAAIAVRSRPWWRRGWAWAGLTALAIVFVTARTWPSRDSPGPAPALVRLTNHIATDRTPSVSPDGRHIAFASNRAGGADQIYVMDADGRDPRPLTSGPSLNRKPVWSPDGRSIAFETDRRGSEEIFIMQADGTSPRPVASGGRPAWSPDSKRLTFRARIDTYQEVFVVDAAGGVPSQLTFDRGFCVDPTWSPDGTRIAFTSRSEHGLEIHSIQLDGTGRMVLAASRGDNRLPVWFRDGRIAFNSTRNGHDAIFLMESDGSLQRQITDGQFDEDEAGWWPDGRSLVFESERDGNSEIYRMLLPDSPDGAIRLTNNLATDESPAWSPDGSSVAFESNRDGKPHVFLMDPDGGHVRSLTRGPAADRRPAWSWDGRRIAFVSDRAGIAQVFVMNADGSEIRRVTDGPNDDAPCWSPDGSHLAFTRGEGIWVTSIGQGSARRLAAGGECSWSPDGTHVLLQQRLGDTLEILRMDADGTHVVNLSANGRGNGFPAWSRDGTRIALNSNRDGLGFGIFVMDATGSGQSRLTSPRLFAQWPSWSPDGRWIVFASDRDSNWEIYKIAVPHR